MLPSQEPRPSLGDQPAPAQQPRSPIQAIDRTVSLLTEIAAAGPAGVPLKILADRVGLHASTGRTLLSALAIHGLVGQIDETRRYVLGPRFFELNRTYELQYDLGIVAAPVLRDLWERTDETVHLSTLREGRRVDLSVLVSRQLLNVNPSNMRSPSDPTGALRRTAAGKALLSGATTGELQALLNLPAGEMQRLAAELDGVRRSGYATNFEEEAAGVCGVAAPVRDGAGRVVAAICVGYPAVRRTPAHETLLVDAATAAASKLSTVLGHSATPVRGDS